MTYLNQTAPLTAGRGIGATFGEWRAAYAKHRIFRRTLR